MFQRTTALALFVAGVIGLSATTSTGQPDKKPTPADLAKAKKALQEVQDFIGLWNLEGTQKVGAKTEAWKEKVSWGWKFKDGDAWITVSFAEGKGKYFADGELRYDLTKKKYQLTLTPAGKDEAKQAFEGDFAKGALKVERKDAKTGDVHRVTLNTVGEGSERLAMKVEKQEGGKGLFAGVYGMVGNRDGVAFAGGVKKPECIVSGGAASIAVQHAGKTYYVCCSGCRDEFLADPNKYINKKN
jgi:YHS domain-containing protein